MINVLIVEDDPMVAEMNKFYLESVEGFCAQGWARTAGEALQMLERRTSDLILLDIYMKEMNGLELLSEIRSRGMRVDVIVISAASDKESIQKALHNGAVDYLIKPFEFARFRVALAAYREQNRLFKRQDRLNQEELDRLSRFKREQGARAELPKGFTKPTLHMVWKAIENCSAHPFTIEEIASLTGISRVTVGKYLAGLAEMGVLEMDMIYGTVGRPVQNYNMLPKGKALISPYL
ncbi:response regulator [Paenibacillus durus]|uniref:Transcriptional regulatory protein n=1 Tax=Paenibacillus durus ATCC 35681 TaxID=1333534 RepID=A0A0F7F976_PAEDU|nr:response regulator [Paenibacillus durus]AKG34468.1 transcriptional regulator [Paenibacillus durus ATCC 35681]